MNAGKSPIARDIARYLEEWDEHRFSEVLCDGDALGPEFERARDILLGAIRFQLPRGTTLRLLALARDLGVANFRAARGRGAPVRVRLEGREAWVRRTDRIRYVDVYTWLNAYSLAALDGEGLMELRDVPEALLRGSRIHADEFHYALHRVLTGLHDPRADVVTRLFDAIERATPSELAPHSRDYAVCILLPLLALTRTILGSDPRGYHATMADALALHREFWDTPENTIYPEGWVSLPLSAMAVLALRLRGYVPPPSPLVPAWIVRREFWDIHEPASDPAFTLASRA